jgi:hypothetical protein
MKKLIALLIITNILTLVGGYFYIQNYKQHLDDQFTKRSNELESFYYGFCVYTKELGVTDGLDYQRLCGDL